MERNSAPEVLYVPYRGDECLGVNDIYGWAKYLGTTVSAVMNRMKASYKKRAEGTNAILFERVVDRDD